MHFGGVDPSLSMLSLLKFSYPVVHRDDYEFLRLIAREYYRVAGEAMEREDRRHLVFGVTVRSEPAPRIDCATHRGRILRCARSVVECIPHAGPRLRGDRRHETILTRG